MGYLRPWVCVTWRRAWKWILDVYIERSEFGIEGRKLEFVSLI